eukprot:UN02347
MKPNGKFYISQAHICISSYTYFYSYICLYINYFVCVFDFCRLISISQYFF